MWLGSMWRRVWRCPKWRDMKSPLLGGGRATEESASVTPSGLCKDWKERGKKVSQWLISYTHCLSYQPQTGYKLSFSTLVVLYIFCLFLLSSITSMWKLVSRARNLPLLKLVWEWPLDPRGPDPMSFEKIPRLGPQIGNLGTPGRFLGTKFYSLKFFSHKSR